MLDKQQQLREQGKVVSLKDMPVIASAEWNVSLHELKYTCDLTFNLVFNNGVVK